MKVALCYAADFETTTDPEDCRVWAYSLCNVEDNTFIYGNNIDDFFEWCKAGKENYTLYYHNLSFDGEYILNYLFLHNYTHIEDKKDKADYTFETLIDDMGKFYKIVIYFKVHGHHTKKVTIFDSMKIFPNFSVARIAKTFGLPISKLKIDYHEYREVGHVLTQQEIDYIRNDVEIVARALKMMFDENLTKMTLASDAINHYKQLFKGSFRNTFPELSPEIDADIRKSYRGGFTYVNPKYKEVELGKGMTLDVNSLYPSVMACVNGEIMPYGQPVFYEGKYVYDPEYPLYVQTFTCKFTLKPGKIPCIQIKNTMGFIANEYLENSNDELITLTLTSPDFELFMDQYDVEDMVYHGGFKLKGKKGLFNVYIDYWTNVKIEAGKQGNPGRRQIAKNMLNSLYGKYGVSSKSAKKIPYLKEDYSIGYITKNDEKPRHTVYIPVAAFTTAYGRNKTIRTSQAIRDYSIKKYGYDAYVYSDTDSIKCTLNDEDLEELKDIVKIDDYKLGYWAKEEVFNRILCIRQKCYIVEVDGKVHPTIAGLPKYLSPIINFNNFKKGFTTKGLSTLDLKELAVQNGANEEELEEIKPKSTYKHVEGGIILADTDFTIK